MTAFLSDYTRVSYSKYCIFAVSVGRLAVSLVSATSEIAPAAIRVTRRLHNIPVSWYFTVTTVRGAYPETLCERNSRAFYIVRRVPCVCGWSKRRAHSGV